MIDGLARTVNRGLHARGKPNPEPGENMEPINNNALCMVLNRQSTYFDRIKLAAKIKKVKRQNRRVRARDRFPDTLDRQGYAKQHPAKAGRMKPLVNTPKRSTGAQGEGGQ